MSPTSQTMTAVAAPERLARLAQEGAARLLARLQDARANRLTAVEIEAMTPPQRRDMGLAAPARPTIEVEFGLMTTLMGLR